MDLSNNALFAIVKPKVILKVNADTGVIMLQKVLQGTGNFLDTSDFSRMVRITPYNLLSFLIRDSAGIDHYMHVSENDLVTN